MNVEYHEAEPYTYTREGRPVYQCRMCSKDVLGKTTGIYKGSPETRCEACGGAVCLRQKDDLLRNYTCYYLMVTGKDGDGGLDGEDFHIDCWEYVGEGLAAERDREHEYAGSRGV